MQGNSSTPNQHRTGEVARVFVGVVLIILLMGLWVHLWMPPAAFP